MTPEEARRDRGAARGRGRLPSSAGASRLAAGAEETKDGEARSPAPAAAAAADTDPPSPRCWPRSALERLAADFVREQIDAANIKDVAVRASSGPCIEPRAEAAADDLWKRWPLRRTLRAYLDCVRSWVTWRRRWVIGPSSRSPI